MDALALLEHEVTAMTAALGSADLGAAVAACPGWTVADLATHVTAIHRWALAALESTSPASYDEVPADDPVQAYDEAARQLVARLHEVGPDAPAWTFDRSNRTASFWRRRQLHEVSVHRYDLAPYALPDEVALDGVDEVMTFFAPRQVALERTTLPAGALVVRTGGRTWALGQGAAEVVEGPPGEVLLRLWGRGAPLPAGWTGLTP